MKQRLSVLFLLLLLNAGAQTGVIAHRSHSGNIHAFNPLRTVDNLGWTGMERQSFDTTTLYFIIPADTTSAYPYCNNPGMTQDSLNKSYPFYTSALPDSTTKKPAAEDTLAKHKERIKSRNEVKKNELIPVVEDFYGNPGNPAAPGFTFIATLLVIM